MTGESDLMPKDTLENCIARMETLNMAKQAQQNPNKNPHELPSPIIMSGTSVQEGDGEMLVIVVGENSSIG